MPSHIPSHPPRAAAGDRVALGPGSHLMFKAVGADTDGAYALMEYVAAPGGGSSLHSHSNEEEAFYILNGALTFQLGEETVRATPGEFVRIPRGMVHAFVNAEPEPAMALIILSPAGLEQFFVELAELVATSPDGTPDSEAAEALNKRFGLDFQ
jgi:quercetin dioxygenase-like cupin family protein